MARKIQFMTVNANPYIVQSGIVLSLDSANPRSYVGTGTAWTDTSGLLNSVTLNNTPTYTSGINGYFTFDGATQWASYATPNLPSGSSDSTMIVWCWPDSTGPASTYTGLVAYGTRTNGSNSRLLSLATSGATIWVSSAYWYNDYVPNNVAVTADAWNMVALVTRGSALSNNTTLYCCNAAGINSSTGNSSASTAQSTNSINLSVGCTDYPGRYFKGRISVVQVYNSAFTTDQITQNFYAMRSRYGI